MGEGETGRCRAAGSPPSGSKKEPPRAKRPPYRPVEEDRPALEGSPLSEDP